MTERLIGVSPGDIGGQPDVLAPGRLAFAAPASQACCLVFLGGGELCLDLSPFQCVQFGGTPAGKGTTCATTNCVTPIPGACCQPDGTCFLVADGPTECLPPNVFLGGQTCTPNPCMVDCYYVGLPDCCNDPGTIGAIDCTVAQAIAQGETIFVIESDAGCHLINLGGNTSDTIPGTNVELTNPSFFGTVCQPCCDVQPEPCPDFVQGYCNPCPGNIGASGYSFTVNECGNGGLSPSNFQLQCQEEAQFWSGTAFGPSPCGPGPFCPGSPANCPLAMELGCDGQNLGFAFCIINPSACENKWVMRVTQSNGGDFTGCAVDWLINFGLAMDRGPESYPNTGPSSGTFTELLWEDNVNVDSFSIQLPIAGWGFTCSQPC